MLASRQTARKERLHRRSGGSAHSVPTDSQPTVEPAESATPPAPLLAMPMPARPAPPGTTRRAPVAARASRAQRGSRGAGSARRPPPTRSCASRWGTRLTAGARAVPAPASRALATRQRLFTLPAGPCPPPSPASLLGRRSARSATARARAVPWCWLE